MSDTTDAPTTDGAPTEPQSVDQLPEWAQREITKARNEAAKYRTEKNELSTSHGELERRLQESTQIQDQHEVLLSEKASMQSTIDRWKAALTAGIPADQVEDMAARLRGESADELQADAAKLAQLFQAGATPAKPPVDPSQGRGNDIPLNGDAFEAAVRNHFGM